MRKTARYTVETWKVMEGLLPGSLRDPEKTAKVGRYILGDYPIFEESHRDVLNLKILKHYAFEEIGFETPDCWMFQIQNLMNEKMPYYNQLYWTESLEYDPLKQDGLNQEEHFVGWGDTDENWTENKNSTSSNKETHEEYSNNTSTSRTDETGDTLNEISFNKTGTVNDRGGGTETGSISKDDNTTFLETEKTKMTYGKITDSDYSKTGGYTNTTKDKTVVNDNVDNRFSDTPEGSVENLKTLGYLTDYRIIATDTTTKFDGSLTNVNHEGGTSNETLSGSDNGENTKNGNNTFVGTETRNLENTKNNVTTYDTHDMTNNSFNRNLSSNSSGNKNTINEGTSNSELTAGEIGSGTKDGLHRDEHFKTLKDSSGIYLPDKMPEIRDMILNLDEMIIKELGVCFMCIY